MVKGENKGLKKGSARGEVVASRRLSNESGCLADIEYLLFGDGGSADFIDRYLFLEKQISERDLSFSSQKRGEIEV